MYTSTKVANSILAGGDRAALAAPALALPLLTALGLFQRARRRLRHGDHQGGASIVEWVLIVAITAAIVIGVGVILTGKFTAKATELDLTTP